MSFKYLNVPMITVFKNLTNVIIVAGDWYWNEQKVTGGVLLSFGVMVMGALAAAYTDVMFSGAKTRTLSLSLSLSLSACLLACTGMLANALSS